MRTGFVRLADVGRELGIHIDASLLERLAGLGVLPVYDEDQERLVLLSDVHEIHSVLRAISTNTNAVSFERPLIRSGRITHLSLPSNLHLEFKNEMVDPGFCSAIRALLAAHDHEPEPTREERTFDYFPGVRVSAGPNAATLAHKQLERRRRLVESRASQFANSAYYMGSKKSLASFIVEAIAPQNPDVVCDLMCGSGAVAGSCAHFWPTVASDAQEFCRILARIQGAGFSSARADQAIETISTAARRHSATLMDLLGTLIEDEDELFHGEANEELTSKYARFLASLPTYPSDDVHDRWRPALEVRRRRHDHKATPYLLFTAYFASVYFGLRQCVEIDSLRYAIDVALSGEDREWALGALIAAISGVGTTYAAHFAQPPVRSRQLDSATALARVLEARSRSIFHEFSVRLTSLARESERAKNEVRTIPGPWESAVATLKATFDGARVLVYVDAPYRREEYSRYYHVLETLVRYDYPSAERTGRVPSKRTGERFSSRFATRRLADVEEELASVIRQVISNKWECVWSYSDAGDASIKRVVQRVQADVTSTVRSFAAPYRYRGQEGRAQRSVREYLLLFQPETGHAG